jgi:hypothetical protein
MKKIRQLLRSFLIRQSTTTDMLIISKGTPQWEYLERVAEIHGHKSPAEALNTAVRVWKHLGQCMRGGCTFSVFDPTVGIQELEFPSNAYRTKNSEGAAKRVLTLVVDNTEFEK